MSILLIFAFISGLVTIFAPCIWPLLPIILSATASGGHRKPLGITLGIITSFAFFTLTISYIVKIIPFNPDVLRLFAVIVIGFLGLVLVIPALSNILEGSVSRLSSRFAPKKSGSGFWSGLLTGFSLGIVWSPCAGPILATIATLAATRQVNFQIILVTLVYVLGVGIPLFIFATLGRNLLTKTPQLSKYTGIIQQIFGAIMILTAILILTNYDKVLQAKLLNVFPSYSKYLTALETQPEVKKQLDELGGRIANPNLGQAPELTGITKWLNSDPVSLAQLKGKVVLIDFWTYTCINCIRTLPHVTSWYEKYKDRGFVVIGIHTPEFEFEKNTDNVLNAIKQYSIRYPVAQDNNYSTWNAYGNQYWPAEYLIDAKGNVRRTHFGEGEYDQTEKAIQDLLKEAGLDGNMNLTNLPDQTPKSQISPETYLGLNRMERFLSKETPKIGSQTYTLPASLPLNYWGFKGTWDIQPEFAKSQKDSSIEFNFKAAKVFLVLTPKTTSDKIKVFVDKQLINELEIGESKLYNIADPAGDLTTHLLHIDFLTEGTEVYAFTFGE